jgi:hypothetical protein
MRPPQIEDGLRVFVPVLNPAEPSLSSALTAASGAHRFLLFLGAPPIDHVDAEAPFGTYPEARQLLCPKQAVDSGGMHPQILG